jgi:hypothetical protein
MTIEIHAPELEALIRERMKRGMFRDVEDFLMQSLTSPWLPAEGAGQLSPPEDSRTGADLIAAMQASPYPEVSIEPARYPLTVVRNVEL